MTIAKCKSASVNFASMDTATTVQDAAIDKKIIVTSGKCSRKCSSGSFSGWHGLSVTLAVVVLAVLCMSASIDAAENKPSGPLSGGLFSHVNSWFSRLRGNRDNNNSNSNGLSSDDKKNDDKKEESTTKATANAMYAPPGMSPMAPGFAPMGMSPYGPMMAAPGAPMYGAPPMGMAGPPHHFASPHHHHGRPHPMHSMSMSGMSYNPMASMPMSPMSNPFAFSGSHVMPVHHDFSESMHTPHHAQESFGSFPPYTGGFGSADHSADDSFGGSGSGGGAHMAPPGHHPNHHPSAMDATNGGHGGAGAGDDYSYQK